MCFALDILLRRSICLLRKQGIYIDLVAQGDISQFCFAELYRIWRKTNISSFATQNISTIYNCSNHKRIAVETTTVCDFYRYVIPFYKYNTLESICSLAITSVCRSFFVLTDARFSGIFTPVSSHSRSILLNSSGSSFSSKEASTAAGNL